MRNNGKNIANIVKCRPPGNRDPERLVEKLSKLLRKGGRLSVAHGMSREDLLKLHNERASKVSLPLPDEKTLAKIFAPFFGVDIMISDCEMYQVSGIRK